MRAATPQTADTQLDTDFDVNSRRNSAGHAFTGFAAELSQRPAWACPAGRLRLLARMQAHQSRLAQQALDVTGADLDINLTSANGQASADALHAALPPISKSSGIVPEEQPFSSSDDGARTAADSHHTSPLTESASLKERSKPLPPVPACIARIDGLLHEFESLHAHILHRYLVSDDLT